jgi:hypothetical protein
MKGLKKTILLLLAISLVIVSSYSTGWAGDKFRKDDPVKHGWSALDLVLARPLGVAAGIVGTAIFVATLPFTLPSGGVNEAANMLVVQPFQFSFVREFPDEDI